MHTHRRPKVRIAKPQASPRAIRIADDIGGFMAETFEPANVIQNAADVARICDFMAEYTQEHLCVLLLNTKRVLVGIFTVYIGTVNTSLVRAAEVYRPAIMTNAPNLIVAHNHPSGDPTPSAADVTLTRRLSEAGDLLAIELLDHVVIGQGRFTSLRERGQGFAERSALKMTA